MSESMRTENLEDALGVHFHLPDLRHLMHLPRHKHFSF